LSESQNCTGIPEGKKQKVCEKRFFNSNFGVKSLLGREQAKRECDWLVMSSVFVASQSGCSFLCWREQIRLVESPFHTPSFGRIECNSNNR
jgi:hypothetical protein